MVKNKNISSEIYDSFINSKFFDIKFEIYETSTYNYSKSEELSNTEKRGYSLLTEIMLSL